MAHVVGGSEVPAVLIIVDGVPLGTEDGGILGVVDGSTDGTIDGGLLAIVEGTALPSIEGVLLGVELAIIEGPGPVVIVGAGVVELVPTPGLPSGSGASVPQLIRRKPRELNRATCGVWTMR